MPRPSEPTESTSFAGDTTSARRTRSRVATVIAVLTVPILALASAALVVEGVARARDDATHPPPGRLVATPGGAVHLHCVGVGAPTVVLEGGLGADVTSWAWVQADLAETTRVCAYDRPGYGWSEPSDAPRDPASTAASLADALERAGEPGPFVIAGHSLGAHYARAFAASEGERVRAVVLVDGRHPDVAVAIDGFEAMLASDMRMMRLAGALAPFGVVRALGPSDALFDDLPDEIGPAGRSRSVRREHVRAYAQELGSLLAFDAAVAALPRLDATPLLVLAAGSPMEGAGEGFWDAVWPLQERFTTLSDDARLVVVEGADHIGILTVRAHATQVAERIAELVAEVRSGS